MTPRMCAKWVYAVEREMMEREKSENLPNSAISYIEKCDKIAQEAVERSFSILRIFDWIPKIYYHDFQLLIILKTFK